MEIKLEDVSYNDFQKLCLVIPNSEIIGITGNGKSLLLKMLKGDLKCKGNIYYNKEKLSNKNILSISKSISYVAEEFINKYSKSTLEEYILYIFSYYKINVKDPYKKMIDSLKIVDLNTSYLDRDINTLSVSEKKKLQIAIALITNPKVLLLDEPFINLDIKNEKKFYRLLSHLNEKFKIKIIIATNNSELLYKYTKYLIVLKDYKLLISGDTKSIYENPFFLETNDIEIPDIVLFTYKAITKKKVNIDYHCDIRDLIKDIYKHV